MDRTFKLASSTNSGLITPVLFKFGHKIGVLAVRKPKGGKFLSNTM